MQFRNATKSAAHHLSIAGRAVLALALAIGASGAIFSGAILGGGGLHSVPFSKVENADAATSKADSTDLDLQKSNEAIEFNSRYETRKSEYNGKARAKRIKGITLSANRFILERQQTSEQDGFDKAATGFPIPGGMNSW